MPRRPRFAQAGYVFHVLNRGAGRQTLFETSSDYDAFVGLIEQAKQHANMRILAYCVMPTHWHLLLWPESDDALSEYMRWLTVTHTQRWHARRGTAGTGPVYQGAVQIVSGPGRRTLSGGLPVRGAKRIAGKPVHLRRELEMEQCVDWRNIPRYSKHLARPPSDRVACICE